MVFWKHKAEMERENFRVSQRGGMQIYVQFFEMMAVNDLHSASTGPGIGGFEEGITNVMQLGMSFYVVVMFQFEKNIGGLFHSCRHHGV